MQYPMRYQIGGTLTNYDPTYVVRQADEDLYRQLQAGEFCYVFNTRQMGKSSLLVRTKKRLHQDGHQCLTLDMSTIGTEIITPSQWYKGILGELISGLLDDTPFNFSLEDFQAWWQQQRDIPLLQRLSRFLSDVLLKQLPKQNLFIMVDEIDSVLSLPFAVDDFFALVRYCYNQRALVPEFQRITFALFGVVTPAALIRDKTRTPFNIGTAVTLNGFSRVEASHLATGLLVGERDPNSILHAILDWTGGQPFLTQKLCQLVVNTSQISLDTELPDVDWVAQIVYDQIIDHWETQDEPEHLRTICDRILRQNDLAGRLLSEYQQVLAACEPEHPGPAVTVNHSIEHIELLLSGLVVSEQGQLRVKNPIYQAVFDSNWVTQQLHNLRPYAQSFTSWQVSEWTDTSRLLRGQALLEAQAWAQGKRLSDADYQFLTASQTCDRNESEAKLKAERVQALEDKLQQEQILARWQRLILGGLGVFSIVLLGILMFAWRQYRRAVASEQQARISEVTALISSAQGNVASDQTLDALIYSIKATRRLQTLDQAAPPPLIAQAKNTLNQAIYDAQEINRFSEAASGLWSLDWGPNEQTLVSVGGTTDIQLWKRDGTLVWSTREGDVSPYVKVSFSPDGQRIAVGGQDSKIRLYDPDGNLQTTLASHTAELYSVDFSPDGKTLASTSSDGTIRLWDHQGQLTATLREHEATAVNISFSYDGQRFVSASQDKTVRLWRSDGTPLTTLKGHQSATYGIAFSPNGQFLVSGDADGKIKIWQQDQNTQQVTEKITLEAHDSWVRDLQFSPDGDIFASASADGTIKLWDLQGRLLQVLAGHQGGVYDVVFSANGQQLFSASEDKTIRVWQLRHPLKTVLTSSSPVFEVVVSPDSQTIASAHTNGVINLWQPDGQRIRTLIGHTARAFTLAFSPDGRRLASGSSDSTIKLWNTQTGELEKTLSGHTSSVMAVRFLPDGETLLSGSIKGNVSLWDMAGERLQTVKQPYGILGLDLSNDGQQLAVAQQNNQVALKQLDDTLLATLDAGAVIPAFSPNGQTVGTANWDGTVQLWQTNGDLLTTLTGHGGEVYDVDFSPNGDVVASGGADQTVRLWSVEGKLLNTLYGHTSKIEFTDFNPDGTFLVSGSADQTAIIWHLDRILALDELELACSWLADYLRTSPEIAEEDRALCEEDAV